MKRRWVLEEKILQPFGKDKLEFLNLIRSAMIGIDNMVDKRGYSHKYFLRIIQLIKDTWDKEEFKIQNEYEKKFVSGMNILRNLFDKDFYQAKEIYRDFLKGYKSDYKWASNRNKILDKRTLEKLNSDIGAEAVTFFIYFQIPKFNKKDSNILRKIVKKYSLAIKLADNLASLKDDILEGFITIPEKEIDKVSGLKIKNNKVTEIDKENLKIDNKYVLKLTKEIKLVYKEANQLLDKNRERLGLTKKQIGLFKEWAYTWLEDSNAELRSII